MSKPWSNNEIPNETTSIPEKKLLAAVLQRAVSDYLGGEEELIRTAQEWLFNDHLEDAPLTISYVCEALDLDLDNLREVIQHQKKMVLKVKEATYAVG